MASRHDRKRAERFAARGIGEADLLHAQTAYLGDGGGTCTLCDTGIVHEFLLTFAREGEVVEFFPVGSKCITDWMRAMPESVGRSEAIARVKAAEKVMRAQRKVLKALTDDGDADAANLMRIFFRLPSEVQEDRGAPLGDIGQRVTKYRSFLSDKQRRFFASLVRQAARTHGVDASTLPGSGRQPVQSEEVTTEAAPEPTPVCDGDPEGAALMHLYRALPVGFAEERGGALFDIGSKVENFGQFGSDRQRDFFAGLVAGAGLLSRWFALPEALRLDGALGDMGGKLAQYGTFRTDRQANYFKSLLGKAEARATDTPPPPPAATQGEMFTEPTTAERPRCDGCGSFDVPSLGTLCADCTTERATPAVAVVDADDEDDPF